MTNVAGGIPSVSGGTYVVNICELQGSFHDIWVAGGFYIMWVANAFKRMVCGW